MTATEERASVRPLGGAPGDDLDQRSFIVAFWARVFGALRYLSVLQLLRSLARLTPLAALRAVVSTYWFVEVWAVGHLGLACVATVLASTAPASLAAIALSGYGLLRTVEIVVTQTNILLFDEWRARRRGRPYRIRGYRRMVILLLQNFAEVVFWFAATYGVMRGIELSPTDLTVAGLIRESFLATVSFGSTAPAYGGPTGLAILEWQGFVGLFVTLLSLARFIGLLPPPASIDTTEATA